MTQNQMRQAGLAFCVLVASGLIAGCATFPEAKPLDPLDESRVVTPDRITLVGPDRYCVSFEPGYLQCKLSTSDFFRVQLILERLPGLRSYHVLSMTRARKKPFEIRVELFQVSIFLVKRSKSNWEIKYLIDHSQPSVQARLADAVVEVSEGARE